MFGKEILLSVGDVIVVVVVAVVIDVAVVAVVVGCLDKKC